MRISASNSYNPNFNGVVEYKGLVQKVDGQTYKNKLVKKIYQFEYHPLKNENRKMIQEEISKIKKGFSFTLWEKDHGHQEGDYLLLNQVEMGKRLGKKKARKLTKEQKTTFELASASKDRIYDIYDNAAYGVMDLKQLPPERVEQILNKVI